MNDKKATTNGVDNFSSFSVGECCKYSIFLVLFTLLMIASRGNGVNNYYITKNFNDILRSNEFDKSRISPAPATFEDINQMHNF